MGYHHKQKEERETLQQHAERILKHLCSAVPIVIYLLFILITVEVVFRIFITSLK